MKKYSDIVTKYLDKDKRFLEILSLIENSAKGEVLLVGGKVFRPLIKELYNIPCENNCDYDLITENLVNIKTLELPKDWKVTKTGLGEPRIINGERQIDLIFLDHAVNPHVKLNLKEMSTDEKINSYFQRVPLNIQMLAYNLNSKKVIGKEGLRSIKEKIISVNCIPECLEFCKRRKISIRKFLNTKINSEIFTKIYPKFKDTKQTKRYYEKNSNRYEKKYSSRDFTLKYFPQEINYFLNNLNGKKILDVGAGFGKDSIYFKSKGYKPYAIDISKEMIKLCKKNGIDGEVQDIENCSLQDNQFDGVYAYCSLLHIPKERIYNSIARISELLKPNGLFFIGMIEGNTQEIYDSRFFSKYTKEELEVILKDYFKIIRFKKFMAGSQTYLNFVCKKF
jgi:2-polyprenyl-3-methyl-5-hydroxy-6-metoxy-1,4-benzoquinol methylase